jgi:hypothetical protein
MADKPGEFDSTARTNPRSDASTAKEVPLGQECSFSAYRAGLSDQYAVKNRESVPPGPTRINTLRAQRGQLPW